MGIIGYTNKIYELVFYWEDIYNGCEITETILTTSRERVEAEIEGFRNRNLKNGGEEVEPSHNHYIYEYKNNNVKTFIDGWLNLKIFEHDKIN